MIYFLILALKQDRDAEDWAGMAQSAAEYLRAFGSLPVEAQVILRSVGKNLISMKKEGLILYKHPDGEYRSVTV